MTREEQIKKAWIDTYETKQMEYFEKIASYRGFLIGAKWADKNPNISAFYHDANEVPNYGTAYIAINKYNDIVYYSNDSLICERSVWMSLVSEYKIEKWIYTYDIFPKLGEQ